jgi:trans-2,3-dihydro-3-hydroxyanthranilate isomerase
MNVPYLTADVFTRIPFGGNPLAVFPDASGIPPELMLAIAREFNYSETTFVLPPDQPAHAARVRIFTPGGELPFAGHPTVGTAHVLAAIGQIRLTGDETRIIFEEGVGPVPVVIRSRDGYPDHVQLTAAQPPSFTPPPPNADIAGLLSLAPSDLVGDAMPPATVSCGVPFLFVPLKDREVLSRARINLPLWESTLAVHVTSMVFPFTLDGSEPGAGADVRARMFAPGIGVPEDPATGSAAVALGGYLAAAHPEATASLRWTVHQGVEMGRPSVLDVEAEKRDGSVVATRVGGSSVIVCQGTMRLP